MRKLVVDTQTDDLNVERLKLRRFGIEIAKLELSATGEDEGMGGQHDRLMGLQRLAEGKVLACRGRQGKIRDLLTDFHAGNPLLEYELRKHTLNSLNEHYPTSFRLSQ